MGIFDEVALYAVGYWAHENHPVRIDQICLNTIQRKSPCSECSNACPEAIDIHAKNIDWKRCSNCNLCITACPTGALNQSATQTESMLHAIENGDSITFGCSRDTTPCDVKTACLCALPWDIVAAAALRNHVVLLAAGCKDCPHISLAKRTKKMVRRVREFLGEEYFSQNISMSEAGDAAKQAAKRKRQAFSVMTKSVKRGAEKLVANNVDHPRMSVYRAYLIDTLNTRIEAGDPATVTWKTLVEDGSCRGCGICAKMCPHDALTLQVPGFTKDAPDERQLLIFEANRCTQCGLCYVSCPDATLGGWSKLTTHKVPALVEFPIEVALCQKCGRPFKQLGDEEKCPACSRISIMGN